MGESVCVYERERERNTERACEKERERVWEEVDVSLREREMKIVCLRERRR